MKSKYVLRVLSEIIELVAERLMRLLMDGLTHQESKLVGILARSRNPHGALVQRNCIVFVRIKDQFSYPRTIGLYYTSRGKRTLGLATPGQL